jgi:hypothetical protein
LVRKMLLTITTTHQPATDLGYLLHKNPARLHRIELAFGDGYVVYTEATPERCTAALVVDVDTVGLVRKREGLAQYVNDRPYAASSFLSVAIAKAFGTALAGRSKDRPEFVTVPLPLEIRILGVPCRGGETILRQLRGRSGAASARSEVSGVGRQPLLQRDAGRERDRTRRAVAHLRLHPRARRGEALLGWRGRN